MAPVTIAVIGGGSRGNTYAEWALAHPDRARVVAVVEPREGRRRRLAGTHGLGPDGEYADWKALAARGRVADMAIVATPDAQHAAPAKAFAELGYHVLLEKPIAPTEAECREIVEAVDATGVLFAVCHVLRYTPYTNLVKSLVDSGRIGDIVSVQHLEPVGYWHYAHSFVRGNWRNTRESSFMLLAKSCHDLDWLQYVVGAPARRVSSFGSLRHFRPENRPAGAADRCLDCSVEPTCAYSAPRLYGRRLAEGNHRWPLNVVVDEPTPAALETALREGPYGRCVYASDNDVVDHQVVAIEHDNGVSTTFTMTAFTEMAHRQTRIFGTRGELVGDGEKVRVSDFLTDSTEVMDAYTDGDATAGGGHGGGDEALMAAFVAAVAGGAPDTIRSGSVESLRSHLTVFAAERARREGTVVTVSDR